MNLIKTWTPRFFHYDTVYLFSIKGKSESVKIDSVYRSCHGRKKDLTTKSLKLHVCLVDPENNFRAETKSFRSHPGSKT